MEKKKVLNFFVKRMLGNNEFKRGYKEDFYVFILVIFSVLSNVIWMIVWLYINYSFVVDLFVDFWVELVLFFWF